MNVVLLGSQGVGKGTYAQRLKDIYKIPHVAIGDLFREEMRSGSKLGNKIAEFVNTGKLVPDDIALEVLKKRLTKKDTKNGFLLDGFPRTLDQAKALEKITKIDKVIYYHASEDVIVDRLSGRRTCRKCAHIYHIKFLPPKKEGVCDICGGELYQREDDYPEAIRKRLSIYYKKTAPLIDYYKKKGLLVEIDANLNISDPRSHIIKDTQDILDRLKQEKQMKN
ncbi:adenylate kinase [Candidatus Woesearchaeota archaeon]|nr:MAG: adenylate kinase [Candidatus Woesearchaeota archaeon]